MCSTEFCVPGVCCIRLFLYRKLFSACAKSGQKIFLAAANHRCNAFLTANSITDIYYLAHRHFHNHKDTKSIIKSLFTLFGILDTCGIDCKKAIISEVKDYEDAVMIETALRSGIDCIVTRNESDYSKAGITVYSPETFLAVLDEITA